jgi:hypothetical protein
MLIKGENLNETQKKLVLEAFGYRWTSDNRRRLDWWRGIEGQPTIPLVTDEQWLKGHAFHFTADGKRLKARPKYCEPVSFVEP